MTVYSKMIPNILTCLRVIAAPSMLLVYFTSSENYFLITLIFVLASFTDWLDGLIARQQKSFSALGKFLDPVADKLLVISALIIILAQYQNKFIILFSAIIISREITVSALREWMASIGKIEQMQVLKLAKLKTLMQMFGIGLLLAHLNDFTYSLGFFLMLVATVLTLYSMIKYLQIASLDLTFFSDHR